MAKVESHEVFRQAVERAGLSCLQERFEALNWATHGRFAFATATPPGQITTEEVRQELVLPLTDHAESILRPAIHELDQ